MKVEKKILEKSQIELMVEVPFEEFKPYIEKGAEEISKEINIEGFRPGKAPLDIVKRKVGEMSILEKSANLAINKLFSKILEENLGDEEIVGQPMVDITKMAPENPLEFKIVVAILPTVEINEYKNLQAEIVKVKIDEKDVERTIDYLGESRVKEVIVDRGAEKTDKIIANVEMFLDKVPLDGGQSRDTTIILGKEYFVPGFDEKIIGAKKDEVREFSLVYPKEFHQKNLAGKNVEFKVTIKDVYSRELPAMDDKFAEAFGAKTMDDLKNLIRKDIEGQKKFEADRKTELNVIDKILAKAKFGDIPEVVLNNEAEKMMMEMEDSISKQGGKMEDYLASLKKTKEQLILEMLPEAIKRVKTALIIRKISALEKIEATDEEVDKKQKELLEQYKGYAKVEERVKDPNYKIYLKNSLTNKKVIDSLVEWNTKK